ncbi:hypothetical protein [Piscinibacter defluvii]|uniref:hypothetical protein n=1 Tax=Piscinibacter defluvii TaxID=1796922 RepID=UPI000FDDAE2A|nr:hypothetical protein [Piscinibacter defluvii]
MAASNKTSAAAARSLQRQAKAIALRCAGLSYASIAAHLGIGRSQAHALVCRGLDDARSQVAAAADELRALELSRLDGMLAKVYPRAARGDLPAVDRVLKISERRAKLLGLDAPERHALQGGGEGAPPIVSDARVTFYVPENGRDAGRARSAAPTAAQR